MMSLTFGLFTQVSGSGPLGPLVNFYRLICFIFRRKPHKYQSVQFSHSQKVLSGSPADRYLEMISLAHMINGCGIRKREKRSCSMCEQLRYRSASALDSQFRCKPK